MRNLYLARQQIVDLDGVVIGYELLFRDSKHGILNMPSNISATAKLLYNSLNHMDLSDISGEGQIVSINCDHTVLLSGFIDLLDHTKFYIEILETTEITDKLIQRLESLKQKGFRFALDDFDCTMEVYNKFKPIMHLIDVIKICLHNIDLSLCHECMNMFEGKPKILLAEKVETKEEYELCVKMGFSLFQGYYISKPEVMEQISYSNATKTSILKIMNDIKHDVDVQELMNTIKSCPDVVMELFKFAHNKFSGIKIVSLKQILIMIGRRDLVRWCLINIHAGMKDYNFEFSAMDIAIARAERMEKASDKNDSTKAYIVGLISALATIYNTSTNNIAGNVNFDDDILDAINNKSGPLGVLLNKVVDDEREHLWNVILANKDTVGIEKTIQIVQIMEILK